MDIKHALEVPVVVQNLFKMMALTLSFTDFKSFRLVCRLWYEESLTLWRKTAVLTLQDAPLFSPFQCPGINPSVFLNEIDNPQSFHSLTTKPYKKYKVTELKIHLEHVFQNQDASRFWSLVGPSIKTLIVNNVTFEIGKQENGKLSFKDALLHFFQEKMPRLEHLTMTNIHGMKTSYYAKSNSVEPAALNSGLPAIKSLTLDNTTKFLNLTDFSNLEDLKGLDSLSLRCLFNSPNANLNNSTIKRLDLTDNINHQLNGSLEESMRFTRLEYFGLTLAYVHEEYFLRNLLCKFLKNHANTLKSMHLFQWNLKATVNNRLLFTVEMKQVTQVKLWGKVVPDLKFLVHLPNLQLLHVDVLAFGKRKQTEKMLNKIESFEGVISIHELETDLVAGAGGIMLPNLTHLFLSCRLSRKSVEALGHWMPNLKTVKAILNCVTLPVVVQQWKQLEKLHCLWGSQFIDSDLQSLVNLTNLWSFGYDAECSDGGSSLTDASADIFLACPQLTHLKLYVSTQFSAEVELLLKEKIQHVQIHKNSRDNSLHKDWECCQFKKYKEFITRKYIDISDSDDEDDSEDSEPITLSSDESD